MARCAGGAARPPTRRNHRVLDFDATDVEVEVDRAPAMSRCRHGPNLDTARRAPRARCNGQGGGRRDHRPRPHADRALRPTTTRGTANLGAIDYRDPDRRRPALADRPAIRSRTPIDAAVGARGRRGRSCASHPAVAAAVRTRLAGRDPALPASPRRRSGGPPGGDPHVTWVRSRSSTLAIACWSGARPPTSAAVVATSACRPPGFAISSGEPVRVPTQTARRRSRRTDPGWDRR